MKHLPLISLLLMAASLLNCKSQQKEATNPKTEETSNENKKAETEEREQTVQLVDSIVFPISPKEIVQIYENMVNDSLYINHHFADRGMTLVKTENYEDAVDVVMRDKCYLHEWAYHAKLDEDCFPTPVYFESDKEDGFGLSLENYEDRRQIVVTLFSNRAKDQYADMITKAGYVEQFTDSLDQDENGNYSPYNTITYFHRKGRNTYDPYFIIENVNGKRFKVVFREDIDEPMYEDDL